MGNVYARYCIDPAEEGEVSRGFCCSCCAEVLRKSEGGDVRIFEGPREGREGNGREGKGRERKGRRGSAGR